MLAVLLHILDMLGGDSCHGVKVFMEYCSQKKLQRKCEKYHTFFTLRQCIEIVYVKVS